MTLVGVISLTGGRVRGPSRSLVVACVVRASRVGVASRKAFAMTPRDIARSIPGRMGQTGVKQSIRLRLDKVFNP